MKFTCPYCDSAFLQFIESEEQLRDHILKAHGRELSFAGKSVGQMPVRSEEDRER
jgi:thiol-disulfide isomerase/thioredoxin